MKKEDEKRWEMRDTNVSKKSYGIWQWQTDRAPEKRQEVAKEGEEDEGEEGEEEGKA